MKQAENNEMDLLLRSLARRGGTKPFPQQRMTEGSTESAHLDADELVSYAERTLPAATRARYTIHLADCAQCRKLVAELAPVVGVSVRDHPEEERETTFWRTVRHFFSLPLLKYAVPALGLLVIGVVGLVVYRQQLRPDMMARTEPAGERVAITNNQTPEVPQQKAAGTEETKGYYDSDSNRTGQQKAKAGEQEQNAGEGVAGAAPGAVAPLAKDGVADKATGAVAQPTFAPEPAPPAPKPQDQIAEAQKEEVSRTDAAARPQSAPAKAPDTDKDAYEGRGERTTAQARSRGKTEQRETQVAGTEASNAAPNRDKNAKVGTTHSFRVYSGDKKADDETVETRTVAGRSFRRQGNLWVDTAYHSDVSLTVVSRGSEQYRALIADEPAIRTIAEQLSGEVILVWKGRGYRIR